MEKYYKDQLIVWQAGIFELWSRGLRP